MKKTKKQKIDKNNPQTIKEIIYDVAVIGAGQSGITLAKTLIKHNMRVLLIDQQAPGIKTSLDIKLFTILTNKYKGIETKSFLAMLPEKFQELRQATNNFFDKDIMSNEMLKFVNGNPKILSNSVICVNEENFKFKKLVFANGSDYVDLNLLNITSEMYINPTELIKINENVETVAIYGTNWIALELGQALTKVGVKVYFVDKNVNPFNDFDDEIEATLKKQYKNNLMDWCLESEIVNHQYVTDNIIRITLISDSKEYSIDVNKIISTETRVPNTKNIECYTELHKNQKGALIIDSSFKVKGQSNFYAIGDINGIHMYPNQGTYQAFLLAQNFIGNSSKLDIYDFGFTINIEPSISFYGMNKNQIEHTQTPYNEFIYKFKDDYKTAINKQLGTVKIFTNKKHEILGVLLIGDKLSELISLFVMAKQNKIKFHKLAWLNLPFFSKVESLKSAALEYYYEFVLDEKKINKKRK